MMSRSRTGKRFLSLLMTFCLTLSLFTGLSVGAYAAADDSWVGNESFDYTAGVHGTGWIWDASTHTLTLSGVNAARTGEDGIRISGDATLVLEGANEATANTDYNLGLCCTGNLTIKGSGTLAVSASGQEAYGIDVTNHKLTIGSGHITATSEATAIIAESVEVNGGYVTAESTGSGCNGLHCNYYSQSGGYVKTNGIFNGLIGSTSAAISGGYLEAESDSFGIFSNAFSNTGGVVKATGERYGIDAEDGTVSLTGGVTIATATRDTYIEKAICGTVSGSDEWGWYDNTNGTLGVKNVLSSTGVTLNNKSVVIAKAAQSTKYTATTADGVYVKVSSGFAWVPTGDATVSDGSYFEGPQNGFYSDATHGYNVAVNKTLVCVATGTEGEGFNTYGKVTMGTNATLYGKFTGTTEKGGITAGGGIVGASSATGYNVIGVTSGTGHAIWAPLGTTESADVPIKFSIGNVSAADKANIKAGLEAMGAEFIWEPIQFTVTAEYGGKTADVKNFDKYTSRLIEIPSGVDATKITTAVVVEDGAARHVPTDVYQSDGKWYAKINSRTNSVYALISHNTEFADAKGLWYEAVVSEMASRTVIEVRSKDAFDGEADITRAEFAALVVSALGLPCDGDASMFTDVAKTAWYCGAVGTAYEYGIVEGRGDGMFDPLANITRQEAMQLIFNAAKVADYKGKEGELSVFTDAASVSGWAKAAAEFNVGSGLVQGSAGLLSPGNNITRAESATIVLRLLQKAALVDIRAKA